MITYGIRQMLADANAAVDSITAAEAVTLAGDEGTVFVDVRETVERQQTGTIAGAVHAPRGFLELIADPEGPMHNDALVSGKRLVLFCASGGRSALAAKTLKDMGIGNVANLVGGLPAWVQAGGPTED